jgi:hypothetical protein
VAWAGLKHFNVHQPEEAEEALQRAIEVSGDEKSVRAPRSMSRS